MLIGEQVLLDDHLQQHLFADQPDRRLRNLSAVVDRLNRRHGRDKVRLGGAGYDSSWRHKRQWMSALHNRLERNPDGSLRMVALPVIRLLTRKASS